MLLRHDCHTTLEETIRVASGGVVSLSLTCSLTRSLSLSAAVGWNAGLSFKHMCLLFADQFSTSERSRGLETPALSCQD